MNEIFSPLKWNGRALYLIDQLALPGVEQWVKCEYADDVADAIQRMVVRGAPAIGCAAAYGVALAARAIASEGVASVDELPELLEGSMARLAKTRPTAVNLFWALAQMRNAARVASGSENLEAAAESLAARARAIHDADIGMCRRIGRFGAELVPEEAVILTHCNAGALATGGYGTALGVVRGARAAGKRVSVLADETRPYLQGSRLTAWELMREGFDVTIIPDGAAAFLISRGEVSCVVVGADRIAANGDVANKIGTYGLALAAREHRVPFYVAAPASTIDLETSSGAQIPIEERSGAEMLAIGGIQIAPADARFRYPAFDITPAELVHAIITDTGVRRAPYSESLRL